VGSSACIGLFGVCIGSFAYKGCVCILAFSCTCLGLSFASVRGFYYTRMGSLACVGIFGVLLGSFACIGSNASLWPQAYL